MFSIENFQDFLAIIVKILQWTVAVLLATAFFECICTIRMYFSRSKRTLQRRHVVITGGSSGIGKAVGIECAKRGANVTIIARNVKNLQEAVVEIQKVTVNTQQKVHYVSSDVTNNDIIERTLKTLDDKEPVYMLVNSAGMALLGKLEDMSTSDIQKQINLNVYGTIYPTRTLIPRMKRRNEGVIVVTASQAALMGIFGCSAYSASKFALRGFSESIYYEGLPHNVKITMSMPPDTQTPGFDNEEKTKPLETKLICEEGGLYSPEQVARILVDDALDGKFFSYPRDNLSVRLLTTVAAGMSPCTALELFHRFFFSGIFSIVAAVYIRWFKKIVENCAKKSN